MTPTRTRIEEFLKIKQSLCKRDCGECQPLKEGVFFAEKLLGALEYLGDFLEYLGDFGEIYCTKSCRDDEEGMAIDHTPRCLDLQKFMKELNP